MIQSIERAARVLEALQAERRLGITELGERLGLSPSTVHGIVATLCRHGLVTKERNGTRYALGPALVRLGNVYLDTNEIRARARPWMDELSDRVGHASRLGVELFDQVLIIHHVPEPGAGRHMDEVGLAMPAHATALGKVLAAHCDPESALKELVAASRLEPLTSSTLTTGADLADQLAGVRDDGIAWEREEGVIGESGLAAPVVDQPGQVVAAIGVVIPESRWPDDPAPVVEALRRTARMISRELGATR